MGSEASASPLKLSAPFTRRSSRESATGFLLVGLLLVGLLLVGLLLVGLLLVGLLARLVCTWIAPGRKDRLEDVLELDGGLFGEKADQAGKSGNLQTVARSESEIGAPRPALKTKYTKTATAAESTGFRLYQHSQLALRSRLPT